MANASRLGDRVVETTTSSGTGSIGLAGAATGYQTFYAAYGATSKVPYVIEDAAGNYEIGLGTVSAAAAPLSGSLSRDTVLTSSNAGALVNFPAGTTKNVFSDISGWLVMQWANATSLSPAVAGYTPIVSPDGNGMVLAAPQSNRNLLINGNCCVAQRPIPSGTFPTTSYGYSNADRWKLLANGMTGGTMQVAGNQLDFAGGLCLTSNNVVFSANGNIWARQAVRPDQAARLYGKKAACTFRVRQNSGVAVTGQVRITPWGAYNSNSSYGTTVVGTAVNVPSGSAVDVTNVLDLSAVTTIGNGFMVDFVVQYPSGGGPSHTLAIGNFQIEEGSVASPFEIKSAALELAECEKYYTTVRIYFQEYNAYSSGITVYRQWTFPRMHNTPSAASLGVGSVTNLSGSSIADVATNEVCMSLTVQSGPGYYSWFNGAITVDGDY